MPDPEEEEEEEEEEEVAEEEQEEEVEVIRLSPNTLTATEEYVCGVCGKQFQRHQYLQLHRLGHKLPWKQPPGRQEAGVRLPNAVLRAARPRQGSRGCHGR